MGVQLDEKLSALGGVLFRIGTIYRVEAASKIESADEDPETKRLKRCPNWHAPCIKECQTTSKKRS